MAEIAIEKLATGGIKFSAKGEVSIAEFMEKFGQFAAKENIPSLSYPAIYFRRGKYVPQDELAVVDAKLQAKKKPAKKAAAKEIRPLRNDKCEFWN